MKSPPTTLRWLSLLLAARAAHAVGFDATYPNNPVGTSYIAELPPSKGVNGTIIAVTAQPNATQFEVDFSGLPAEGGPFRKSTPPWKE
jgi:hypothetical protein